MITKGHKRYRDRIKKQFESTFADEDKLISKPYYHFIMYGNEGLEGYKVVRHACDITSSEFRAMELRCRYNSHRKVALYGFRATRQVDEKEIDKQFLFNFKDYITKLFPG